MPTEVTAAAAAETTTTLTAARQSSQLLQLLRLVLQGSIRDLGRYLVRGGDPNASVYQAAHTNIFCVSTEEYTGPRALTAMSLLAVCCFCNWAEQVSLLINAGADPDSDAGTDHSPMSCAAARGLIPVMALLTSKGAALHCEGYTPLMAASETGSLKAVKWLVQQGVNVTATALVPGQSGRTIPSSATASGSHLDVLHYLHARGAPFECTAAGQTQTALHEAAARGFVECLKFILTCGFAVDCRSSNGMTALHMAAQYGCRAIVDQLLDSGADIAARDDDDRHTPRACGV